MDDVVIVGGGAAGLATAIFAARACPRHSIALLDGARRLGAKILISGGGRCNVTNDVVTANDFCGGSRNTVRRVLSEFPVAETVAFFRELGVALHVEPTGKMFPDSNRARTVLDALVGEAERRSVRILTQHRVGAIRRRGDEFAIETNQGELGARRVVLATGGQSVPKTGSDGTGYRLAESLGHSLVPRTPALVALVLDGDFHQPLSGVSHDVELTLRTDGERPTRLTGALLWTHFGASGPVVMDISRHWHAARLRGQTVALVVNFLPGSDLDAADRRLRELIDTQPRTSIGNALAQWLPARVAHAVLADCGVERQAAIAQLPRALRRRVAQALVARPIPVRDSRGYDYAEVTAGGVPLDEIHPGTMESRKCPGLFLVGEILDVDGRIGGFNFQWAWSSAWVAARALCG